MDGGQFNADIFLDLLSSCKVLGAQFEKYILLRGSQNKKNVDFKRGWAFAVYAAFL